MVNIRFLVTDFASHRTWVEGYQRHTAAASSSSPSSRQRQLHHDIRITWIPGDRWKFRMMAAAAELVEHISLDDELLVVDAMLDVTVLVALLRSTREPHQCPSMFVYFHENQLTTPFTTQDRDYHKAQPTHWHYGMAHWRSLLVADGCIFNSQTHLQEFANALPKCLNEQCPRDTVEWHLTKCRELLAHKCTVLHYGLELDELVKLTMSDGTGTEDMDSPRNVSLHDKSKERIPVILWNARLEDDKNPATFLKLLHQTKAKTALPFQLVVLGTDPSKGQRWYTQIRHDFGDHILFMGWCQDRSQYSHWLSKASIVVSTAIHETFGISMVESVHCGALPLLPNRLSYPEIFGTVPRARELYLYDNVSKDGVAKLIKLLEMVTTDPKAHCEAQAATQEATRPFQWHIMSPMYDQFFSNLAKGDCVSDAREQAATMAKERYARNANSVRMIHTHEDDTVFPNGTSSEEIVVITDANDARVQLFRPKSLRDHKEYSRQWSTLQSQGMEPALHGGRRAMVRMLEAIEMGAKIQPIAYLTTPELAETVLVPAKKKMRRAAVSTSKNSSLVISPAPINTANKDLLNTIRGQKLNIGDAILAMVQFPMPSTLDDLLANPPLLILENLRNAENVGSILRTAFCLGIRSIVASATAWSALKDSRAARCSMGTMYYHRYFKAENTTSNTHKDDPDALVKTIHDIQRRGFQVYGIELGETAKPIAPHGPNAHWAAVMGNEDLGLSSRVSSACQKIVYIPQVHGDSLNVGHAAAIAMFELGREGPTLPHDGLAACP